MSTAREMRLRIRSVKNIAQVTRALETVSASKVRRAIQAVKATEPYAVKAWKVLVHIARQPGHSSLHPLLVDRAAVKRTLVVLVSGDRGLAGSYNVNIVRQTLHHFENWPSPVSFITIGRKGRDMLVRRRKDIIGEFSNLPSPPSFMDVSAIGRLAINDFQDWTFDEVYISYTDFVNMIQQVPIVRRLLPLRVGEDAEKVGKFNVTHTSHAVFAYEPDQNEILDSIIPRFTSLQIYQAILEANASEHAARMMAMRNATDNANELAKSLQLDYNKARQQSITSDMLDIAGGAEALAKVGDV
jgi:F-type H+-transporting ATPase subunit gamma